MLLDSILGEKLNLQRKNNEKIKNIIFFFVKSQFMHSEMQNHIAFVRLGFFGANIWIFCHFFLHVVCDFPCIILMTVTATPLTMNKYGA